MRISICLLFLPLLLSSQVCHGAMNIQMSTDLGDTIARYRGMDCGFELRGKDTTYKITVNGAECEPGYMSKEFLGVLEKLQISKSQVPKITFLLSTNQNYHLLINWIGSLHKVGAKLRGETNLTIAQKMESSGIFSNYLKMMNKLGYNTLKIEVEKIVTVKIKELIVAREAKVKGYSKNLKVPLPGAVWMTFQ